jgi:Ni/Co efflux regulator RcnB
MKTVVPNQMVAHLWAHQAQEHAKNGKGSFYFDGNTIYSYGAHFPIAKHIVRNGEKAILFTADSRSVTTAGHKSRVSRAIPPATRVFTVASLGIYANAPDHKANLNHYAKELATAAKKATRARSEWNRGHYLNSITRLTAEAKAYAEFFGVSAALAQLVPEFPAELDQLRGRVKEWEKERARLEQEFRAKEERRKKAQQRKAKRQAQEAIQRWKAGENVRVPYFGEEAYLRVVGDTVETSQGAIVPLSHALRIVPLVRSGVPYQHNGHSVHIGHFRIDSIDEKGNVRAGCHFITRQEIERIATELKV